MTLPYKGWVKFVLEWVAFLMILAAIHHYFYQPSLQRLQKMTRELNEAREMVRQIQQTDLDQMRRDAERLAAAEAEYTDLYGRKKAVREKMPFEPEMGRLTKLAAVAADSVGVVITALHSAEFISRGEYQEMPIRLEYRGGFANTGRYLEKLETRSRLLSVMSVSIETNKDDPGMVTAVVQANAYRFLIK